MMLPCSFKKITEVPEKSANYLTVATEIVNLTKWHNYLLLYTFSSIVCNNHVVWQIEHESVWIDLIFNSESNKFEIS